MIKDQYPYGIILGRLGKIEGYFSSLDLLKYCADTGFEHIEDMESLKTTPSWLRKQFKIIEVYPNVEEPFPVDVDLLILQKDKQFYGAIDLPSFNEAVVKMQHYKLRHFETVFNAVPNGIMAVNIEGKIIMMNPAAEKISGVPPHKAMGSFITDVVPTGGLLQVLQTGQGHIEKYKVQKRWYISHREPIFDGKQLVGAVGVFEDVSKMESLSSELESVRQLIKENEALMASTDDGIAIFDEKSNILRQNTLFHNFYVSVISDNKNRMAIFRTLQDVIKFNEKLKTLHVVNSAGRILLFKFASIFESETQITKQIIVRIKDVTVNKLSEKKMHNLQKTLKYLFLPQQDENFVKDSPVMKELDDKVKQIAKVSAPVLIKGGMGTGRTSLAKYIVLNSERKDALFIEIDCLGKSEKELQHLIFSKSGNSFNILRLAARGTIYFKNIDYLPYTLQEQLAGLLASQFTSDESKENILDIRIISSISKEIDFISVNAFSEKLYYLINAITLSIPPPNERLHDVQQIILQFIATLNVKYRRHVTVTKETLAYLMERQWKRYFVDIFIFLEQFFNTTAQEVIHVTHIDLFNKNDNNRLNKPLIVNEIIPLKEAVKEVERELLYLLSEKNMSYRKMAKVLDVNPSTIVRKVKRLNIDT